MRSRAAGKGRLPESDRGIGPAPSVSPDTAAHAAAELDDETAWLSDWRSLAAAVTGAADRTRARDIEPEPEEVDAGAERDIDASFRRQLAGLRRLPRHERPAALRLARDWRADALRALREKRDAARRADYQRRRLKTPEPC